MVYRKVVTDEPFLNILIYVMSYHIKRYIDKHCQKDKYRPTGWKKLNVVWWLLLLFWQREDCAIRGLPV